MAGRETGWIVWPRDWRCARERCQAVRTGAVSSDKLYSRGTPMRREVRGGDVSCVMRERVDLDMLVGSRGSWWFRVSDSFVIYLRVDRRA